MKQFSFTIYGRPQQRGSKTPYLPRNKRGGLVTRPDGRPVIALMDDNKKSKDWMATVRQTVGVEYRGELLTGPISLTVAFYFARPKSHYGTGRNAGVLKESAPERYTQKPDTDKLIRTIGDCLTGIVIRDDCQICVLHATKMWTDGKERVEMTVTEMYGSDMRVV